MVRRKSLPRGQTVIAAQQAPNILDAGGYGTP